MRRADTPPPRVWPELPSWIDPTLEVTDTADRDTSDEEFVTDSLATLAALGCPRERAFEVVAHCAAESSWGRRVIGHNAGGVKLSQTAARAATRAGRPLRWFRAPGHLASGDGAVAYYQAFSDDAAFWSFWMGRYVPRSAALALALRDAHYAEVGRLFWGGGDWFASLLLAGYRGEARAAELAAIVAAGGDVGAHPSVAEHRRCVARVRALAGAP